VRDEWTHSPTNGVLLCRTCHSWVHKHPFEARASGYIVSRWCADPGTVPVRSFTGQWLELHQGGGFVEVPEPNAPPVVPHPLVPPDEQQSS
jgi:hypothetical protein